MGQMERFKARYVVKRFMQVERLYFNSIRGLLHSVNPKKKRILLALGAQDDLVLHLLLPETVFMEQSEGCSSGENQGCLLQR